MRTRKAVQFMFLKTHSSELIIEQLRYAGVLSVQKEDGDGYVLRINCPSRLVNDDHWAESNQERMSTFGINAVVVK